MRHIFLAIWQGLRTFGRQFVQPSLIMWALIAMIGVLAATLLSDGATNHDRSAFTAQLIEKTTGRYTIFTLKSPPWYLDPHIYGDVVREICFAFLIAAFVGAVIESRSRRRIEQEIASYSQEIARDVFLSTMRLSASESVWDELSDLISKMKLIRQDLNATYELIELSEVPEFAKSPEIMSRLSDDYVAMKWDSDFFLANKSDVQVDHRLVYTYPIRTELDRASELSFIHKITVNGIEKNWETISKESSEIKMDEGERLFEWPITIPAKARIRITSTVYILKNRGDNEVWATVLPTETFHLTLINSLQNKLDTGIQSNFPGQMQEENPSQTGSVRRWAASRPLLPYQSVVLWWRKPDQPLTPTQGSENGG